MMNKIIALTKKELHGYFSSPVAYIILIACLSLFNVLFFMLIEQNREVSLRDIFQVMEFMFIFIIPLLTMKLFSEEKANGTMEFLLTAPLTPSMIVLGKYFSMLIFYSLLIAVTSVYYFIVEYYGEPDPYSILSGYIGIWLEGAFFIAIGLLTSSWTRNQIIAAMTSYVILFSLYFSVGVITASDVIYYLAGIVLCLVLTTLSINHKLWQ